MSRRAALVVRALLAAVLGAAALAGAGCDAMDVHPWDRDLLAQPKMRFVPKPLTHAADEHIYFSKEGSTGGSEAGGGGCGCN